MTPFTKFEAANGPRLACRDMAAKTEENFRSLVPSSLLTHWQEVGFCGYAGGLLWLTDPSEFSDLVRGWVPLPEPHVVIARNAFADLFVLSGSKVSFFSVQFGQAAEVSDVEFLFNFALARRESRNDLCGQKEFRKARRLLGDLQPDECYGCVPAMPLGGSGTIESMRKVKLREYLAIVKQASA